MEKKLVVLTAAFALTAGLVFAQTMKNTGDDMQEETNAELLENAAIENGEELNAENGELNEEMNAEINAEVNAEVTDVPAEMPMNSAE